MDLKSPHIHLSKTERWVSVEGAWFVLPVHESCADGLDDGLVRSTLHVYIANMTMLVDRQGADHLSMGNRNRGCDVRNDSVQQDKLDL